MNRGIRRLKEGMLGQQSSWVKSSLCLGRLYGKTGKLQQAKACLNTGVAMMREMGTGSWLEKAEAELNELG